MVASVHVACNAALKCTRRTSGCDWNNLDVTDYVVQRKYMDSRWFGLFLVERQVGREVFFGIRQVTVYVVLCMRTA